jgi:O-antigen ligase
METGGYFNGATALGCGAPLKALSAAARRTRVFDGRGHATAAQIIGAIVVGFVAAFVAATMDPVIAASLGGGVVLVLLGLRWPLLPLFVFVALVPIEDTLNIGGLGTLSRWSGIVFAGVYAIPRIGRLVPGALPLTVWAYVGWAVLSVAWAVDPWVAQGQLQTLVQLAIIGFLVADVVIHDPTVVRPLLWAYSISAAATAAIGIGTYLVGGPAADGRAAAIANQNPAQFASLLLPALIFGLHELLNRRYAAASGLVALLCTAGIVVSGTRSVWLAAALVTFFLLMPRLGFRRAIVALAVVGVLVLATFQIPGVAGLVAERTGSAASSGGAGRTDIWAVGIEIFDSSPVIGLGYANFPVAFTAAVIRSANVTIDVGAGRGPHNVIIGTAGELGIVGLVLLALFVLPLVLRRGWGPDALVVQAILASLMIDALFLDILSNRKQVWVAIGLAAGLAYLAREARRRGDAEEVGAGARTTTGDLSLPRPTRRKAITATAPGSTA